VSRSSGAAERIPSRGGIGATDVVAPEAPDGATEGTPDRGVAAGVMSANVSGGIANCAVSSKGRGGAFGITAVTSRGDIERGTAVVRT
jgi:hypothetical protein